MKIRNGFVSNSSSSSFVVAMNTKTYNKLIDSVEDYEKKVLDFFTSNNGDIYMISYINGEYGEWLYDRRDLIDMLGEPECQMEDHELRHDMNGIFDGIKNKIKDLKEDVVIDSMEF